MKVYLFGPIWRSYHIRNDATQIINLDQVRVRSDVKRARDSQCHLIERLQNGDEAL